MEEYCLESRIEAIPIKAKSKHAGDGEDILARIWPRSKYDLTVTFVISIGRQNFKEISYRREFLRTFQGTTIWNPFGIQ